MDGFIKLMEWWMKCAEKGKINHQWSASEHMDEQTDGWRDGWMTFWIDASSEISADKLNVNKRAASAFVLSEVNVSTASEDLLSFWFFCLRAEWVHSQNVSSCLIPLHHQSPFLCLVFLSLHVCLFFIVCSSLLLLHVSCKSHSKHHVSHFGMECRCLFYSLCMSFVI